MAADERGSFSRSHSRDRHPPSPRAFSPTIITRRGIREKNFFPVAVQNCRGEKVGGFVIREGKRCHRRLENVKKLGRDGYFYIAKQMHYTIGGENVLKIERAENISKCSLNRSYTRTRAAFFHKGTSDGGS